MVGYYVIISRIIKIDLYNNLYNKTCKILFLVDTSAEIQDPGETKYIHHHQLILHFIVPQQWTSISIVSSLITKHLTWGYVQYSVVLNCRGGGGGGVTLQFFENFDPHFILL